MSILFTSCSTRHGLVDEYEGPVLHRPLLIVFNIPSESIADSTFTCEGIVSDSITSEPIIGANVWIINSKIGASTEIDGKFKLIGFRKEGTIKVSFVNYQTKVIAISDLLRSFKPESVSR